MTECLAKNVCSDKQAKWSESAPVISTSAVYQYTVSQSEDVNGSLYLGRPSNGGYLSIVQLAKVTFGIIMCY